MLIILVFLPFSSLVSQSSPDATSFRGTIYDDVGEPLIGATVRWIDGPGTITDAEGKFQLEPSPAHTRMAVSYIGFATLKFNPDTVQWPYTITLIENGKDLDAVEVTARDKGSFVSTLSARNVESLTSKELRKAPCCTLAESFENSPVVDLQYGDPLTGRREIRMLGLRGSYTLLTLEKRPLFTGLASPYAFDMIPGTWVSGIQIGKGSGSVESSAAGLNGQINTELHKPIEDAPLFINLFGGSQGRAEANVHLNQQLNKTLSAGLYLHGSFTDNEMDNDDDGFKDMPDRRTRAALFRLFRSGGDAPWEGQWNVYVSRDKRTAGQLELSEQAPPGSEPYSITQDNDHVEVFGKTGYFGFAKPHQSIGFIYSGSFHRLNNRYGRQLHRGEQRSAYFNALYHTQINAPEHQLAMGLSGQLDDVEEAIDDRLFDRRETTLGAHAEYTYNWESIAAGRPYRALTAIVSLRGDHHNLGGVQFSPRLNVKLNTSEQTAFRLSAGRGWRSPNILVENLNFLPSSREVFLPTTSADDSNPGYLGLETAWNFGLNYTQNFTINDREGSLVMDYFRTDFQNQIVLDVEQHKDQLLFYQLDGASFSNSAMVSLSYEILPKIDLRGAYKFAEVKTEYATNGLRQIPLTPRHRALASLDYDGSRFRANLNYQWIGRQRLPDHDFIPASVPVAQPQIAPSFGLLNAQFTYVANSKSEFYAGAENITAVSQRNAIIGAAQPFDGGYFDASQVFQPLNRRLFFVGWRYTVGG